VSGFFVFSFWGVLSHKQESLIVLQAKRRRCGSYLGEICLAPENLINQAAVRT